MIPFWSFFIKKRQFTFLLMGVLLAAGTLALFAIPKESSPEVRIPIGVVITVMPGASAADVEQLVTKKIEDGVSNISNLDKLTSSSREGVSSVMVQFEASADLDKSLQDLKDAVDTAKTELPSEAKEPSVTDVNFADQPILTISVAGDYLPAELTKLGNTLKDELKSVQGVSKVELSGVQAHEVQVIVNKEKLDQYGVRLVDVIGAIQGSNVAMPIGNITMNGVNYALKFEGEINAPAEIGDLALTGTTDTPIYVRDIAFVSDGVADASTYSRVSSNGEPSSPSLTLSVFKASGGNVITVADNVKKHLDELKKDGTISGNVVMVIDQGEQVRKDLTDLTEVGLETMLLVMLCLFLTIGWRESVVAGLSIPLSFLIAFIGLYASDNTINFISLFSLILAIGILVDSGIVVTEAIHTRTKKYPTIEEAAYASLREYAWPLIAGTMTTVAMFVPLFFLTGIIGQFIRSIPFTLIFVLLASIFVALGLVPILAIKLTGGTGSKNKLEMRQEEYTEQVQHQYRTFLERLLDNRRAQNWLLISMVVGFILVVTLPATGLIKSVLFPADDVGYAYLEIEKPQGTTLHETDMATRAVEEMLYNNPNIESFVTTIGAGSALNQNAGAGPKFASITILLKDKEDRPNTSDEILAQLRTEVAKIHNADVRAFTPSNGPPSGAPVLITFSGDDLDSLERTVSKAETVLAEIPGTTEIDTSTKNNGTEFTLTVDKSKATAAGVGPALIAQTLRAAVSGVTATTIRTTGDDIDVNVKLNLNPDYADTSETNQATTDAIRGISIQTPKGPVLLGSLLTVNVGRSNAVINHEDRKRIQTVSSYTTGNTTAVEITNTFEERMLAAGGMPEGVTMKIGGETEDIQKTFVEMILAFVGGILLMFAILVLEFNSFRKSIYLLLMILLSLIGVFIGLLVLRQPLSFTSILGMIALAGVVINHAIILMDSMHRIREENLDMELKHAVIEAAVSRLRPIFLTTITTVIGMIPLMGISGLWSPLATAIMFGLTFSMVLTLAVIPVLYYRWPGKAERIREKEREARIQNI